MLGRETGHSDIDVGQRDGALGYRQGHSDIDMG